MSRDLATLAYILDTLADHRPRRAGWTTRRDSRASHNWLIPSWQRLEAAAAADGVGFFGDLRPDGAEPFPAHLEPRVAETAARQGWLLAYLNVRFEGPVYANLVVVTERAAVSALAVPFQRESSHAFGTAPTACPPVEILETLYIDYRTSPPRREVRAA